MNSIDDDLIWFNAHLSEYEKPKIFNEFLLYLYEIYFSNLENAKSLITNALYHIYLDDLKKILLNENEQLVEITMALVKEHPVLKNLDFISWFFEINWMENKQHLINITEIYQLMNEFEDAEILDFLKKQEISTWEYKKSFGIIEMEQIFRLGEYENNFLNYLFSKKEQLIKKNIEQSGFDRYDNGRYSEKDSIAFRVVFEVPSFRIISDVKQFRSKKETSNKYNWNLDSKLKLKKEEFLSLIEEIKKEKPIVLINLLDVSYQLIEGVRGDDEDETCKRLFNRGFSELFKWRNFLHHLSVSNYTVDVIEDVLQLKKQYFHHLKNEILNGFNSILEYLNNEPLDSNSLDYLIIPLKKVLMNGLFLTNNYKELKKISKMLKDCGFEHWEKIISENEKKQIDSFKGELNKSFSRLQQMIPTIKKQDHFDLLNNEFEELAKLKKRIETSTYSVTCKFLDRNGIFCLEIFRPFPDGTQGEWSHSEIIELE